MKRLICFHLFNDFSGSPKVLRMVLGGLLESAERRVESGEWRVESGKVRVEIVTSKGEGALSDLDGRKGVRMHRYAYRFSENGAVTMLRYSWVQLYVFLLSFRYLLSRETVFYINTILPVGAALAGRLMGKRVVYHYHENASAKGAFYRLLARAMQGLASEIVCVSAYQRSFLKREKGVYVVPNAAPESFTARLKPNPQEAFGRKRVLMLGSLKRYKGTQEFVELAGRMKDYAFELVLNETQENIDAYWKESGMTQPENLTVHARQKDVVPFYNRASVVLNLTNKNMAIETFGLTAIEAMSAGLPVIVPTVGGIAEIVEDGVNGYKTDVQELDKIEKQIGVLLENRELYTQLAQGAYEFAQHFNETKMTERIGKILMA